MGTLKPQSNGQQYGDWYTGWVVTFGTARRGLGGGLSPHSLLFAVTNVTTHPSTASVPTSYYLMWHYNRVLTLKG